MTEDIYQKAWSDSLAKFEEEKKKLIAKYGKRFDKEVTRFTVNKAEQDTIDAWLKSLLPEILALQKEQRGTSVDSFLMPDEPYYGAIGGGVEYRFTPTGLGDILIVKESTTGKELNVSDALDWHFFG